MKSRPLLFNGFLALLALALLAGCGTTEERKRKKELSTLRVHVETDGRNDLSSAITVLRTAPLRLNIEREPLLDENNVEAATVEEQFGGFVIRVKLNRQGAWVLERATVMSRGRHLVIHSHFGEARWLAAPLITGKNSTGELVFTPDCSREEADRIARGLNNAVRKLQRKESWPFPVTPTP